MRNAVLKGICYMISFMQYSFKRQNFRNGEYVSGLLGFGNREWEVRMERKEGREVGVARRDPCGSETVLCLD